MTRLLHLCAAVAASAALTGCATGATIQQIRTDPGRYQNKSVRVSGTVNSSIGSPLLPVQYYTLNDGTVIIGSLGKGFGTAGGAVMLMQFPLLREPMCRQSACREGM